MRRYGHLRLFFILFFAVLLVACGGRDVAEKATSTEETAVIPTEASESTAEPRSETETESEEEAFEPSFETVEVADGIYSFGTIHTLFIIGILVSNLF